MIIIIMISVLNMPIYKQSVNARRHLASTSALSNASIGPYAVTAFLFMSWHLQYLHVQFCWCFDYNAYKVCLRQLHGFPKYFPKFFLGKP